MGRDDELRLYYHSLINCLKSGKDHSTHESVNFVTCLHIKGDPRQGLTRLLDEIVYITPKEIPVNRFTLNKNNRKVSFNDSSALRVPPGFRDSLKLIVSVESPSTDVFFF